MSMNTYPLEQPCALVVTPEIACAILLKDAFRSGNEDGMIPESVLKALEDGLSPWACATDPGFRRLLAENDWFSVSDAHDVLEAANMEDVVHCSEFDGEANPSTGDGFGDEKSAPIRFDDDYLVYLAPMASSSLFKPAYASKDELLDEYRRRLGDWLPADFPYARFVMDVSGTYFC